jgi:hypothetical protein
VAGGTLCREDGPNFGAEIEWRRIRVGAHRSGAKRHESGESDGRSDADSHYLLSVVK